MSQNAQVISVLSQSDVYHPDTKRLMNIYVVSYVTEDGRVGETSLFLYADEPENDNILHYPLSIT